MDTRLLFLLLVGVALLGMSWLPRVLERKPLSPPILYILFGIAIFWLPLGFTPPDPVGQPLHNRLIEYVTEAIVIISLAATGLKIDRPPGLRAWRPAWRLLGITMLASIAALLWLGQALLGLGLAGALLLGAVLAPTDPVLASSVQVGPPREGREDGVRFALTAEAGLNDGLAFPFTYLAIALVQQGGWGDWLGGWFLDKVLYSTVVGVLAGLAMGWLLAYYVFHLSGETEGRESNEGLIIIAATFLVYSLTELLGGYGFLAVFVAAVAARRFAPDSGYHELTFRFADQIEKILLATLLIGVGGLVAGGVLGALTSAGLLFALLAVLVVRPLAGLLGFVGSPLALREKLAISFFGIRGMGSLYYLAYALHHADFEQSALLWAVVTVTILFSVLLHGISASPVMAWLDQRGPTEIDGPSVARSD